jgi:hypothetical protein
MYESVQKWSNYFYGVISEWKLLKQD